MKRVRTNTADAAEVLFERLLSPLGMRPRQLLADFKDASGLDRHMPLTVCPPPGMADTLQVRHVKALLAQQGYTLTGLTEGGRCLYIAPGMLEESLQESGIPVPRDMPAYFARAGLHPVNERELLAGWAKEC